MRGQGSMEFIIILSATALFSVGVLGAYLHFAASQRAAYAGMLGGINGTTVQGNAVTQPQQRPYMYASIPNVTYSGRSANLQLVIYTPDGSYIDSVAASGAGVRSIPGYYNGIDSSGINALTFYVIPNGTGERQVEVTAKIGSDAGTTVLNDTVETYALGSAQPAPAGGAVLFDAAIRRLNESVLYRTVGWSDTYSAYETSHCSYENFWYQQLGEGAQCGNAVSYFWAFSGYCYWDKGIMTKTYCVYLKPSGTTYGTLSGNQSYRYSIGLDLYNYSDGINITANLTSGKSGGTLREGNGRYGYAAVGRGIEGITEGGDQGAVVVNKSGSLYGINYSSYYTYLQDINNLKSILSYYDGTGVGGSQLSEIDQAMSSYNKESAAFSNALPSSQDGCDVYRNSTAAYYACTPVGYLDYNNITAMVGNILHRNGSIDVLGSTVNIR